MWIKVSCLEAAMLEEAHTTEQVPQSVPTAQVPGDSQHQPPDTYTRCLQPAEIFSDEALGVMTEAMYVYRALPNF